MKKVAVKMNALLLFTLLTFGPVFSQNYQKLTGIYKKNSETTIMCPCHSQGLLSYVADDGKTYIMTLCFDTEPGSFYEIYEGEKITVEGNVKSEQCANGNSYLVLSVVKSQIPPLQRKSIVDEFIKNQPKPNFSGTKTNSPNAIRRDTISGYLENYNSNTKYGCLFVDKEMVEQGIANGLQTTNSKCNSSKHGKGCSVNFNSYSSDRGVPPTGLLVIFYGFWDKVNNEMTFCVTSAEEFF